MILTAEEAARRQRAQNLATLIRERVAALGMEVDGVALVLDDGWFAFSLDEVGADDRIEAVRVRVRAPGIRRSMDVVFDVDHAEIMARSADDRSTTVDVLDDELRRARAAIERRAPGTGAPPP